MQLGCEAGGDEAGAGADFERAVAALERERLQQPPDDARTQHVLSAGQRHFGIREGEKALFDRDEPLARHVAQQPEHAFVEHVPGTHLLLDHLFARVHHSTYSACAKGL